MFSAGLVAARLQELLRIAFKRAIKLLKKLSRNFEKLQKP
jgi:hypothetical protein